MIFEIIGRPKEYLAEALEKLIDTIGKENNVKIINRKINEPKLIEDNSEKKESQPNKKETFSSFAELDVEFEELFDFLRIIFNYMPSHVELFEPEKFELKNIDLNSITNEILRKLHYYDSIAKSALVNNRLLVERLNALTSTNNNTETLSEKKESPIKKTKKSK
jgi:hypothetical protein